VVVEDGGGGGVVVVEAAVLVAEDGALVCFAFLIDARDWLSKKAAAPVGSKKMVVVEVTVTMTSSVAVSRFSRRLSAAGRAAAVAREPKKRAERIESFMVS
jgi:hypothetical protein